MARNCSAKEGHDPAGWPSPAARLTSLPGQQVETAPVLMRYSSIFWRGCPQCSAMRLSLLSTSIKMAGISQQRAVFHPLSGPR